MKKKKKKKKENVVALDFVHKVCSIHCDSNSFFFFSSPYFLFLFFFSIKFFFFLFFKKKKKSIMSFNAKAKFAFPGGGKDQLKVKKGEIVNVYNSDDENWWMAIKKNGEAGLIPSAYFVVVEEDEVEESEEEEEKEKEKKPLRKSPQKTPSPSSQSKGSFLAKKKKKRKKKGKKKRKKGGGGGGIGAVKKPTNNNNNNNNNIPKKKRTQSFTVTSSPPILSETAGTPGMTTMRVNTQRNTEYQLESAAYLKWVNAHLSSSVFDRRVQDLFVDLQDGVILVELMKIFAPEETQDLGINPNPKLTAQKLDNLQVALSVMKDLGVDCRNIEAQQLLIGDPQATLSLLWSIGKQLGMGFNGVSHGTGPVSDDSAGKFLQTWVNSNLEKVSFPGVSDLSNDWRSGQALLALICSLTDMDYESTKTGNAEKDVTQAFQLAKKHLAVSPTITVQDVVGSTPNQKGIMLYLSLFVPMDPMHKLNNPSKRHSVELTSQGLLRQESSKLLLVPQTIRQKPEDTPYVKVDLGEVKKPKHALWYPPPSVHFFFLFSFSFFFSLFNLVFFFLF